MVELGNALLHMHLRLYESAKYEHTRYLVSLLKTHVPVYVCDRSDKCEQTTDICFTAKKHAFSTYICPSSLDWDRAIIIAM
jgi:hypothetical protein